MCFKFASLTIKIHSATSITEIADYLFIRRILYGRHIEKEQGKAFFLALLLSLQLYNAINSACYVLLVTTTA